MTLPNFKDEDEFWDAFMLKNVFFTQQSHRRAVKVRRGQNLVWGPVYLVGGLGLIAISYFFGGDSYLVFWGAMISGGLMILAGVYDLLKNLFKKQ